jgi:hypothetical protein
VSVCTTTPFECSTVYVCRVKRSRTSRCSRLYNSLCTDALVCTVLLLCVVQVWAQEQEEGSRKQFDSQEQFVPWKLQRKHMQPSHTSTSDTTAAVVAAAVPEHAVADEASDSLVLQRYCHVFAQGELESLAARLQGLRVLDSGYDKGNWHVQLERTPHQVRVKT